MKFHKLLIALLAIAVLIGITIPQQANAQYLSTYSDIVQDTLTLNAVTQTGKVFLNDGYNEIYLNVLPSTGTGFHIIKVALPPNVVSRIDSVKLVYYGAVDSTHKLYGYIGGKVMLLPVYVYSTTPGKTIPATTWTISGTEAIRYWGGKAY